MKYAAQHELRKGYSSFTTYIASMTVLHLQRYNSSAKGHTITQRRPITVAHLRDALLEFTEE